MVASQEHRGWTRRARALLVLVVASLLLAACGGGDDEGAQVQWIEGTPPPEFIAGVLAGGQTPTAVPTPADTDADTAPNAGPTLTSQPQPAEPTATPSATAAPPADLVTGGRLTEDQLAEFLPNELGVIPVLEYHRFTTDPDEEEQFTRMIDDFTADLQWLYDNGFYVVPLKDMIQNTIKAPAGKRPVVLTFDDSSVGQFRYLIGDDGTVTIDPNSAVGVMESFYAAHPDFGRGGFFAVLPQEIFCFSWQNETEREDDQNDYCRQKLSWLLDNGYEIGNHTLNHTNLNDVDDDTFRSELAGAIEALQAYDRRIEANILAVPFGSYPDAETKQTQRRWMKEGFTWDGQDYLIIGSLMVGSNPTESPVSTEFDSMWIARMQVFDEDANVKNAEGNPETTIDDWFDLFKEDPGRLYTSDGDPNIVTVPDELPASTVGSLDTDKVEAEGKELVRY